MNTLDKTHDQRRDEIMRAEQALLTLPQIELLPNHYFTGDLCARELLIPQGAVITGKIHLKDHLIIIPYGDITITTDSGIERVQGPITFVGRSGSKRAVYAHEETLWICIHATDAKTPEEAENTLVTNDYNEFLVIQEDKKCLTL